MWLILPTVGGREEEWEKIELKNNIKPDEGHWIPYGEWGVCIPGLCSAGWCNESWNLGWPFIWCDEECVFHLGK